MYMLNSIHLILKPTLLPGKLLYIICLLLLFFQTAVAQPRATAGQSRKPNIIFTMSDDHAYQAVSAYGSRLISTPNIDRIGREGAVMLEDFTWGRKSGHEQTKMGKRNFSK